MKTVTFEFCGTHHLEIPDGKIYQDCTEDIIRCRSYPLPKTDAGPKVRSVVDLGAHAGEFTVMAAVRWPQATIYAYEPNPQIIPYLQSNCRPYQNIEIRTRAVDVKARRDKLYFNDIGSVAATVVNPGNAPPGTYYSYVEIEIDGPEAVLALKPEVLKIDIEGPEGLLLAAMRPGLENIYRIYVEFHHENIRQHIERLLIPTHTLEYARILQSRQGELMYVRRS